MMHFGQFKPLYQMIGNGCLLISLISMMEKRSFMIIVSKHNLIELNFDSIKIGDTEIKPVSSLRNLGALSDENLTTQNQIMNTCSTVF